MSPLEYQRIDEVAAQLFALAEELKQVGEIFHPPPCLEADINLTRLVRTSADGKVGTGEGCR